MVRLNVTKIKIFVFIFAIIACPGIYLQKNLIHLLDILVPIYYLSYIIQNKMKKYSGFDLMMVSLKLFVFFAFFSIVGACLEASSIHFLAVAKWIRLLYIPMVYTVSKELFVNIEDEMICKYVLLSGIVSGLLGIILFLQQSELYRTTQTMVLGGKVLFRAGGVFSEAISFSWMMEVVLLVAVFYLNYYKKMKTVCILAVSISALGMIVSYSRTTIVAMVICLFYWIVRYVKTDMKVWIAAGVVLMGLVILFQSNEMFRAFIVYRILPLLSSDLDYNRLSSGRISLWGKSIEEFSEYGIMKQLFGAGYKVGMTISDNSFLYTLKYVGIFGFLCYIGLVVALIKKLLSQNKSILKVLVDFFIISFCVVACFTDAISIVRPVYLTFMMIAIFDKANEVGNKKALNGIC